MSVAVVAKCCNLGTSRNKKSPFWPSMTAEPLQNTEWLDGFQLIPRKRDFVLAYLSDPNATRAAEQAGYKHPGSQGNRLLKNVIVQQAIAAGRERLEAASMLDAHKIVQMWSDMAQVDPTDLVQHRRGCCRYCHGIDNEYQWTTPREYREAFERAVFKLFPGEKNRKKRETALAGGVDERHPEIPNDLGGFGYRQGREPNPSCPECDGFGVELVTIADTATLSPKAKLLFEGVEETRHGRKIKLGSRQDALNNLARHFNMFGDKDDPDKANPLETLVAAMMANAAEVPVKPDEDEEEVEP